jgi:DNA-binding Lrp family transcriptional regulator
MPRSSKIQIDEDEKMFLTILQQNSGESVENIAKKCGFSRQKVWRIKKRLEKNKTIWGYNAIVDDERYDKNRYIMLFKKSTKSLGDNIDKIIDLTVQKKSERYGINIITGGLLHGSYDWMVIFTAKDIRDAKKLKEILVSTYPDMISDAEILEFIFPLKLGGIVNPEIEKLKEFF